MEGDADLVGVMKELIMEKKRRDQEENESSVLPMRADHGHLMNFTSSVQTRLAVRIRSLVKSTRIAPIVVLDRIGVIFPGQILYS